MRLGFDKPSVVWVGVVAAAAAAFVFFVSRPRMQQLHELKKQIEIEHEEWAADSGAVQSVAEAQRRLQTLQQRTAAFDQHVPDQELLGSFLQELARAAESRELRPDAIEPGKPIRSAEVVALPIAFKVKGSFPAVFALVQDIERMSRLVRFDRLTAKAEPTRPGTVVAEMSVRIFFRAS